MMGFFSGHLPCPFSFYKKLRSIMENKPPAEKTETKLIDIMLPEELMERVQAFCAEKDMTMHEFVNDAIIEKLELAYKEKRKKRRL
jgi:regulator of PEP synthase PpsR (kinase-PPPase family)